MDPPARLHKDRLLSLRARRLAAPVAAAVLAVAAVAVIVVALLVSRPGEGTAAEGAAPPDGDAAALADVESPDEPETDHLGDAAGSGPDDVDGLDRAGVADADAGDGAEDGDEGAAERGRLVIHHVGDVNLDRDYVPVLAQGGATAAWDGARDTFGEADLVIANLECAASDGGIPQDKQFVFQCDLAALPAMRDAGVDVVTLANNHSGDLGIPAMVESVTNVEAVGITAIGVGVDEADAYRPRVVEVAGWRVALLGFGGVVPVPEWTARGDQPGQATGYDPVRMAQAVAAAREVADVVVASVHWGIEGAAEPRPEDVRKARAMAEAGVDVVFGHHAHRLQPLEVVDGVPVFWSLGNFVWPRLSQAGAMTAVGEWVVEPDGAVAACLVPFALDARGMPAPTGAARSCT